MRVLISFPGRAGDLLWALPTIRALSRQLDDLRIDLALCGEFATLVELLERQPYLGRAYALPTWGMSHGWEPPTPITEGGYYDQVIHLGNRRWPELPLPLETRHTFNQQQPQHGYPSLDTADLHLDEPWITNLPPAPPTEIAIGFSECHFELKVGLVTLLSRMNAELLVLNHDSRTRWAMERPGGGYRLTRPSPWLEEAAIIKNADVFLGCNSGLHVLAVAVGTPVVMYEPMTARHNPIFFPVGMDGPQVTIVRGLDDLPSFDARHTRETLERVLHEHTTTRR